MGLQSEKRKGFTLVELSIVLVIIGLLIGGILAAQSMISTSKVEAAAMQIGQFDAEVESFKTKYNYLPGDAPAFGGDGNGYVGGFNYNDYRIWSGEMANFWFDLDQQQFPAVPGVVYNTIPGPTANVSGPSKNVPEARIGKKGSFFIATPIITAGTVPDPSYPGNYYALLDPTELKSSNPQQYFTPTSSANSAVKPADLLALDTKIDDGVANAGNVYSGAIGNCTDRAVCAVPLAGLCSAGAAYSIGSGHDSYECTPIIRIGARAGDPQ